MAPESLAYRTYSKKSDVWSFGIVGECLYFCVCMFSHSYFNHFPIQFTHILVLCWYWYYILILILILILFDISVWNCCAKWTSYKCGPCWCWTIDSVSSIVVAIWLFLIWVKIMLLCLFQFMTLTHHTQYLQRPRIDTRDSSRMSRETRTIDENVLEQRSQSTSCIPSLYLLKLCLFWFVKLTLTLTFKRSEMNLSLFQFYFLVDCCIPWFETHKLKELWNHLCNVATITATMKTPLTTYALNLYCLYCC
jgi:serine/threonine protein kinase